MEEKKGKISLILGGSGYGKSTYALKRIIAESMANADKNYIIVVPEQFTMAAQKKVVELHPRHGVSNIDIVSFNRLAFRVFEEIGISSLSVLDDTGKTLILKRVIEENKARLGIYKRKASQNGFVEEMKSAISELYSYGVDLERFEELTKKSEDKPYMAGKLKDIGLIYRAFKEALGEKHITKEELLKKLCQVIDKSVIIKNSSFYFDGFTGFTPVQEEFLGRLLEQGLQLTIAVTIDGREVLKLTSAGFENIREQELFKLSKTTVNRLFALAAKHGIGIAQNDIKLMQCSGGLRYKDNKELDFLEKNLFRGDGSQCESRGSIKIWAEDTPVREAEEIAAFISRKVREEGLRYRDFAVITGDLDTYRKPFETAFRENDIPVFMDNKRRLIMNPCVNAIRQVIGMVADNFSYESVFGFLKSDISGIEREKTDRLENYVLEYGIRGRKKYERPFVKAKNAGQKERLSELNETRERFFELVEDITEAMSGGKKTVRQYTEAIYFFMEKLDMYNVLSTYEKQFKEANLQSLAEEYSQTYALVIGLLDKLVDLMGDTVISLKEYGKLLDSGLEEIKVGVIPLDSDAVVIGDIQRTRLSDIKALIVAGVNDGIIPSGQGACGLFTQRDRSLLKSMGVELSPTARENIFIQRFYLYQNLTKPSSELLLTYSHTSAEGKALRPSYLIGTVLGLFKNRQRLMEKPQAENIYTIDLGLKYVAEHFINSGNAQTELLKELYTYFFKDESLRNKILNIVEGAYFSPYTGQIDSAVADVLYGRDSIKNPTRLEKYAACGYAHFLKYGLKLVPRRIYDITAADMGNIYHSIIEAFSKEMKKAGTDFRRINDDEMARLLDKCMEDIGKKHGGDIFFDTERNKYLLNRIREVSYKTLWALSEHVKAGKFEPSDFEMSFEDGRVDRVDYMEEADKLYVKIIDYKSGSKKFDMDEVMSGLQIQLIYYMGAVLDTMRKKHGEKAVPGGAFYFNVKSPYIDRIADRYSEDMPKEERERLDEKYREALLEEYRMTGMVNSDYVPAAGMDINLDKGGKSIIIPIRSEELNVPIGKSFMREANFNHIIDYVRENADRMCLRIMEGDIKANPYKKDGQTPCDYCEYRGLCSFNEKYTKGSFRKLKSYETEDIKDILEEMEKGGGAL